MSNGEHDHWLVRPDTIRKLWVTFVCILALLVALDLAIDHHSHFGIDGIFGFSAWYGFLACVVLVIVAKAWGALFKRRDAYYDA